MEYVLNALNEHPQAQYFIIVLVINGAAFHWSNGGPVNVPQHIDEQSGYQTPYFSRQNVMVAAEQMMQYLQRHNINHAGVEAIPLGILN